MKYELIINLIKNWKIINRVPQKALSTVNDQYFPYSIYPSTMQESSQKHEGRYFKCPLSNISLHSRLTAQQ